MPRLTLSTPLLRAALQPTSASQFLPRCIAASTRSFSHLPGLRPTLQSRVSTPSITTTSIFRQPATNPLFDPTATATAAAAETAAEVADVTPRSSVTTHPAFAMQVRFAPRPTMSGHSRLIQKRRHGFLSRVKTKNGRKTLQRRKTKGRLRLSA
ncbi:hypothetical protein B0T16DRAFT_415125 [Cercophora newfieldiana]|uniref:Ribosomal protein L34 n=1 Tax=Cercophora newfieldiana TaxID=92897 RepID=A0AA39Y193_9PEZI|nr:hypothetical protein B0T16DRAFT_415125 [Cercophora newfieldiana]